MKDARKRREETDPSVEENLKEFEHKYQAYIRYIDKLLQQASDSGMYGTVVPIRKENSYYLMKYLERRGYIVDVRENNYLGVSWL